MNTKALGIVVLVLILLSSILVWGNKRYQRYKFRQKLKAFGQAQSVYENDYPEVFTLNNRKLPNETVFISDPNIMVEEGY